MRTIMSLLAISTCLLNNLVLNQSIPTQAEQADLLANVQEVFEHVKLLTKDIADSTEISVVDDVGKTVTRAEYTLELLEKITLSRLSCDGNSVCTLEARPHIAHLRDAARRSLAACAATSAVGAAATAARLRDATSAALGDAQRMLDALGGCGGRPGLASVACYRGVVAVDAAPVKAALVGAMGAHRRAQEEGVATRTAADGCVDGVVGECRDLMEGVLERALKCG